MNNLQSKILYTQQGAEFEIHNTPKGFTILRVISPDEAKLVGGHYRTLDDLIDAMGRIAIFSGDDASSLQQIDASLKEIKQTLTDHLKQHGESWG